MLYIESTNTNPYYNLALEQYVFDKLDASEDYFILWQNDNTIVVGKYQNTVSEINQEYVNENKINVVRRLSGGGAVYHDMGNINFTFIVSEKGDKSFDFKKFCEPVIMALKSFGINAELSGRNDMTIEGKKFSGNSQYRKKDRVMHHGTIMYDADLEKVSKALIVNKDKIESKGIKSVRSRITNIKPYMEDTNIDVKQFKDAIRDFMIKENNLRKIDLNPEDVKNIIELQKNHYEKWDWNYGTSPNYSTNKKRRIENVGSFDIFMDIKDGKINNIKIYGDFFTNKNMDDFEKELVGLSLEKSKLKESLKGLELSSYIHQLELDDFVNMLCD